jgi:hypothetical protein
MLVCKRYCTHHPVLINPYLHYFLRAKMFHLKWTEVMFFCFPNDHR